MPTKHYQLTKEQQSKVLNELPDILRARGYEVEVSFPPFEDDDEDSKSCPGCGAPGGYGSAGCTCD